MTVAEPVRASLRSGTVAGRYTIERLIGAGGMGEVYAARDTTLGRRVAIKILSQKHAADAERVRRFIREAEAASSLNHPAIVSIYDSGVASVDGEALHFLAMEYLEGEPLSSWLKSSRQTRKKIEVLAQVADGLARAHTSGIVHRDLKPDNIIVTRDGYAKIVDFGVAKLIESREGLESSRADTLSSGLIGTVAYMSPEQIEGRTVDHRSDIFSFGCVLYEALGGKSPFRRHSAVDTLHAIVHEAPERLEKTRPDLQRIVRRCLAKDPEERYQSIKDAALDLRDLAREWDEVTEPNGHSRRPLVLVSALVLAALAAVAIFLMSRRTTNELIPVAAANQMRMTRLTSGGNVAQAVISPDGKYLVYAGGVQSEQALWVRQIAAGTEVQLVPPARVDYTDLDVSSDGNYVYYTSVTREDTNVYSVWQIPILGGTPRKISHDTEERFALSPDGRMGAFRRVNVLKKEAKLFVIDLETGRERMMLEGKYPGAFGPLCWATQGRKILFVQNETMPMRSILRELDVDTGATRRVLPNQWWRVESLVAVPDGSGLVASVIEPIQAPQLWFIPFEGTPRKITNDLSWYGAVSVTADSQAVVAIRADAAANIGVVDFSKPDSIRFVTSGPGNFYGSGGVRWLPNGELLFTIVENGPPALCVMRRDGTQRRTITRGGPAWLPAVSKDGSKILFVSSHGGPQEIWMTDVNGTAPQQISVHEAAQMADFFPDGNEIAYVSVGNENAVWKTSLRGGKPERLTKMPVNGVTVSPDGKSLLCRLRGPDGSKPLWRTAVISLDGGETRYYDVPKFSSPRFEWMADGRGFAYLDNITGAANIWFQPIDGSAPTQLTRLDTGTIKAFDFSPDGKSVVLCHSIPSYDAVMIRGFR